MDTKGYLVLPGFFDVSNLKEKIEPYRKKTEYIFNGSGTNDHKRRQVLLPLHLVKEIQEQILCIPFLNGNHIVNDFVLLRSLPACERQSAHTDYIPDDDFRMCDRENIPYLLLYALEDKTTLIVWEGSHKLVQGRGRTKMAIEPKKIELISGDALIFRGDLVHAGSEYESENIRIHCYIDSNLVPRNPNRTWIIHKHANDLIQQKIIE